MFIYFCLGQWFIFVTKNEVFQGRQNLTDKTTLFDVCSCFASVWALKLSLFQGHVLKIQTLCFAVPQNRENWRSKSVTLALPRQTEKTKTLLLKFLSFHGKQQNIHLIILSHKFLFLKKAKSLLLSLVCKKKHKFMSLNRVSHFCTTRLWKSAWNNWMHQSSS